MAKRAKWLVLPILVVLIAGGFFAWQYFSKWESTDDAQVEGHIHPVNAKVGGTVVSVMVDDNQHVKAGDILAQLDVRDFEIACARASAQLAEAEAAGKRIVEQLAAPSVVVRQYRHTQSFVVHPSRLVPAQQVTDDFLGCIEFALVAVSERQR